MDDTSSLGDMFHKVILFSFCYKGVKKSKKVLFDYSSRPLIRISQNRPCMGDTKKPKNEGRCKNGREVIKRGNGKVLKGEK